MDHFEEIKRTFDGEERLFRLGLAINAPNANPSFYNRQQGLITLRGHHVRGFYDPVLEMVLDLITWQIMSLKKRFKRSFINVRFIPPSLFTCEADTIQKVAIVGGLSCSPYFRAKIIGALRRMVNVTILACPSP